MAKPIKQEHHVARQDHHCYLCGHAISAGDRYLAVTFRALPADGWSGIRYAKVCRHCQGAEFCACGDCDFVIPAEPAERIGGWLADPVSAALSHHREAQGGDRG
ncbi:hypothetical protein [Azospirillum himalayense]|uniref:Uncharacterized protein n=1 Tax=Azospirillum himalayense TaxID=654847 RepID=A0ABW0GB85_9PROT